LPSVGHLIEPTDEVARGVASVPALVDEADSVGQYLIAEDHREREDARNADWRAYEAWVADGNTAYAADYEPGEDAQAKPAPAGKRKAT